VPTPNPVPLANSTNAPDVAVNTNPANKRPRRPVLGGADERKKPRLEGGEPVSPAAELNAIPPCPADAPEWFQLAYGAISKEALGAPFNKLIAELIGLEATYQYKQSGRAIPAQGRPKELTTWIGAGRGQRGGSGADGPTLSTKAVAAAFEKAWWAWWTSVQPVFRNVSERPWAHQAASILASSTKDWARLRHPGPNGMFIVVLGLYW
jgi:hypothetical protein